MLQQIIPAPVSGGANWPLSDWADMANVLVAFLAFGFSIYSFWIQRQ